MAAMGHRAIAEIQFAGPCAMLESAADLEQIACRAIAHLDADRADILPAFDQIVNEAAKFRYRSGGMVRRDTANAAD